MLQKIQNFSYIIQFFFRQFIVINITRNFYLLFLSEFEYFNILLDIYLQV